MFVLLYERCGILYYMVYVKTVNSNKTNSYYMQEILVIAHCLANPTVRLKGLTPPMQPDFSQNIIQLPCPEFLYLGPRRWEVTSEQLDVPNYRRFCREIFQPAADTIQMLNRAGHSIRLIGIAGSPSCGAKTTSTGMEGGRLHEAGHTHTSGTGIFFDEVIKELEDRDIEFIIDE